MWFCIKNIHVLTSLWRPVSQFREENHLSLSKEKYLIHRKFNFINNKRKVNINKYKYKNKYKSLQCIFLKADGCRPSSVSLLLTEDPVICCSDRGCSGWSIMFPIKGAINQKLKIRQKKPLFLYKLIHFKRNSEFYHLVLVHSSFNKSKWLLLGVRELN